jgi:hypothetical protein
MNRPVAELGTGHGSASAATGSAPASITTADACAAAQAWPPAQPPTFNDVRMR